MMDAIKCTLKLLGADGGGDRQAQAWPDTHTRLTRERLLLLAYALLARALE